MRTSEKRLNKSLDNQIKQMLYQTFVDLGNSTDVSGFLDSFLTEAEHETFAKRLAIAYWLRKGRSYSNIKTNLKVSSATIASVQSMVEKPGFQKALKKLEAEEWASVWATRIKKFLPSS